MSAGVRGKGATEYTVATCAIRLRLLAFDEALRRDPVERRRWVVLVDGEPKQLRAVKAEARRAGVTLTILVDLVHVLEYVWGAARALFGESNAKAERWVSDRLLALLTGRSGGDVARTIRWWAARQKKTPLGEPALRAIDKACDYLADRTRTRLLGYQDALRDGLPIATGVIEGACRYLVKDRMDRTGARWSLTGAEAILRLRAVRASGDFDAYWQFHLARDHERNHGSRYEHRTIPDPLPPKATFDLPRARCEDLGPGTRVPVVRLGHTTYLGRAPTMHGWALVGSIGLGLMLAAWIRRGDRERTPWHERAHLDESGAGFIMP